MFAYGKSSGTGILNTFLEQPRQEPYQAATTQKTDAKPKHSLQLVRESALFAGCQRDAFL